MNLQNNSIRRNTFLLFWFLNSNFLKGEEIDLRIATGFWTARVAVGSLHRCTSSCVDLFDKWVVDRALSGRERGRALQRRVLQRRAHYSFAPLLSFPLFPPYSFFTPTPSCLPQIKRRTSWTDIGPARATQTLSLVARLCYFRHWRDFHRLFFAESCLLELSQRQYNSWKKLFECNLLQSWNSIVYSCYRHLW